MAVEVYGGTPYAVFDDAARKHAACMTLAGGADESPCSDQQRHLAVYMQPFFIYMCKDVVFITETRDFTACEWACQRLAVIQQWLALCHP